MGRAGAGRLPEKRDEVSWGPLHWDISKGQRELQTGGQTNCPLPRLSPESPTFLGGFSLFPLQRAMNFDTSLPEVFNSALEDILCPSHTPILAVSCPCCSGQRLFPSFGDKDIPSAHLHGKIAE